MMWNDIRRARSWDIRDEDEAKLNCANFNLFIRNSLMILFTFSNVSLCNYKYCDIGIIDLKTPKKKKMWNEWYYILSL